MISTKILIQDSLEKVQFFKETFLLADTSMEVVLKMSFLFLSNANIKFAKLRKHIWKLYITAKALSTTSWVQFINKRKFIKIALDGNLDIFIMQVVILEAKPIYSSQTAQIAVLQ